MKNNGLWICNAQLLLFGVFTVVCTYFRLLQLLTAVSFGFSLFVSLMLFGLFLRVVLMIIGASRANGITSVSTMWYVLFACSWTVFYVSSHLVIFR